jgi:hypothetical protein
LRRNKTKYVSWDFIYTHDNFDLKWRLYAPPKVTKGTDESNTTPLISKPIKKILRKNSDPTILQKEETKSSSDILENSQNKNLQMELPNLEKSHSDYLMANNNNIIRANIVNDMESQHGIINKNLKIKQEINQPTNSLNNHTKSIHREQNKENTYELDYQYSMNKDTPGNFQSTEFINVYVDNKNNQMLQHNQHFNKIESTEITKTSYVPKKIIRKEPQKINEAFKTRPENVILKPELKIINNDSKNNDKNISSYSQSRIFQNENLKRNQVFLYTFNTEVDSHQIKRNENIILKSRNLENNKE